MYSDFTGYMDSCPAGKLITVGSIDIETSGHEHGKLSSSGGETGKRDS